MKSCPLRLETIADPGNLREAFLRAAKGKAHRPEVIAFRACLDHELERIRADVLDESIEVGRFHAFTIFEPKERRIHAPCFRERVLHHAIIGPSEPWFERWLIDDTYACRRGKGRERAVQRAEEHSRRYGWFLKLDVAKYFDSIPHATLLDRLSRRFRDPRVIRLLERIVGSYSITKGCGLPIGTLTSQHLANFFLGEVDRLVKQTYQSPGYVRYMDDMVVWDNHKPALVSLKRLLDEHLSELGLRVKDSWHIQPTRHGMNFLGYRVRPNGSSLSRMSRRRFVRRWLSCDRRLAAGEMTEQRAQRKISALIAFVRTATRERILSRVFLGIGHRAPTGSTAEAAGTTRPPTADRPTATGTILATATTTWDSASPSAHAPALERAGD